MQLVFNLEPCHLPTLKIREINGTQNVGKSKAELASLPLQFFKTPLTLFIIIISKLFNTAKAITVFTQLYEVTSKLILKLKIALNSIF
jgi:hypothetical protein